jgi:protease I
VDCYHLRTKYTDPVSTMIFTTLEQDLAESEQRLASLYQASLGMGEPQPAAPSTSVAVG